MGCNPVKEAREDLKTGARTTVQQIDRTQILSDLTQARQAIQSWQSQHESFPPDLAALQLKLQHPQDLEYEASTGKISSKTYPKL